MQEGRPSSNITPLFVGLTVTTCLVLFAPLTQAGLNPARDFAPRLVALLFGWGSAAFPDTSGGAFWVYIASPVVGAVFAGLIYTNVIVGLVHKNQESEDGGEQEAVERLSTEDFKGVERNVKEWKCLMPGRPNPTYRYKTVVRR